MVQWSYLCHREVFDSHVSRTVFPSTSLWGKRRRFGAPVAFSLSTAVSDASRRILDVLINVFLRSNRTASCSVCFLISGLFWKVGDVGPPSVFLSPAKQALYLLSYIFVEETVNAIVERSLLFHIILKMVLLIRVINPCASHMPLAGLYGSATPLVGPRGAKWICERSSLNKPVE